MKLKLSATGILCAIVIVAGAPVLLGDRVQKQCIGNSTTIRSASNAYRRKNSLPEDATISPADLVHFLPDGKLPKCPLSDNPYPAFVWKTGPTCPNSKPHNKRFR